MKIRCDVCGRKYKTDLVGKAGTNLCPKCLSERKTRTHQELTIFCPKEGKEVPVWFCAGSYVQGREVCSDLIEIRINYPERKAERKCALEERDNVEEG